MVRSFRRRLTKDDGGGEGKYVGQSKSPQALTWRRSTSRKSNRVPRPVGEGDPLASSSSEGSTSVRSRATGRQSLADFLGGLRTSYALQGQRAQTDTR
jgi:hypothetical protein